MSLRRRHRETDEVGIDLTPMLDIVFIMLIFFIVTTSYVKDAGISVATPSAASASKQKDANIFIAITSNGDIWVDRKQVDIRLLRNTVARLHADQPEGAVIIQSDADATTRHLVDVMDQVRLAGVDKIALGAKRTEQ